MAGSVDYLPVVEADPDPRPSSSGGGPDHPMRIVTRNALGGQSGWQPETRTDVNELFDRLADEWHTRDDPNRYLPVADALDRGQVAPGRCLELGSGTGLITGRLAARFDRLIAADLSMEMLRRAPDVAPRARVDASVLPFPDGSVDVLLLMNMLLFPEETARVLSTDGAVVWVNSRGAGTPIYLPADDVVAALPGEWSGVASEHGSGSWCVARRTQQVPGAA